jgi:hypothetical protein
LIDKLAELKDNKYEVEKIYDYYRKKQKCQFLIQWKGFELVK